MRHIFILIIIVLGFKNCEESFDGKNFFFNQNSEIFIHDGIEREYLLHIPESYDTTSSYPLVFNFHGFGGYASEFIEETQMLETSESQNFILVYPQGTLLDGLSHWNAALNSTDNKSTVNDIDFIQNLITHLSSEYAVDTSRIYACGYSNGAMFSYALACYTENKIAAIGSISGTLIDTSSSCSPSHEIPLIKFHGTQDQVLPFSGNSDYFSVFDIIDFWRYKNNILGESDTLNLISDNNLGISKILHLDNNNNISIENYIVTNGGHEWFNFNIENHNISELVLDFFDNYDINGTRNQ